MVDFTADIATVPTELVPLIDNQFMETQKRWQNASFDQVVPERPRLNSIDIGGEVVRIAGLPAHSEWDGSTVALAFPFQQPLNDTMILRTAFMQQAVLPNSSVLLLPNIHRGANQTFSFSNEDKTRLAEGSLAPLAEKYARVFEKLQISTISLTGYSQGARTSLEIAAVGSDAFEVSRINADETPSERDRNAKQLQKDFMKSGGYGEQVKSMGESGFGELMEDYTGFSLMLDYAKFGIASLGRVSKLIHQGMTGSVNDSLRRALDHYPELRVKLGVVEGSLLSDLKDLKVKKSQSHRVKVAHYSGAAANRHTTGDNYAAHALMVKHGLKAAR